MNSVNIKVALFLVILIILIFICGFKKEGFLHPGHPSWPWYWYNFPTRMYVPTRNMVYDVRGPVNCPNFGKCGTNVRKGGVMRHPANYLWYAPDSYPHFYYYDYYYPAPRFNYSVRYDADGSMYKVKEEKVETVPSANIDN